VEFLAYALVALGAYLLGSIPTGYLMARAKGIDIRTVGSGNIGATNAFRVLGKGPGVFVLLVDAAKGCVAVVLAALAGPLLAGVPSERVNEVSEVFQVIAGLGAILGHNFTCWLKFKGGKGVATSAGVLLALLPKALGIAFGAWVVAFALSRYVSLASITAAVTLPVATWLFGYSRMLTTVSAIIGVLTIYRHRGNIQRLLAGTENRVGAKKPPEKEGKS
jgi:glycerol-3-phosphate acyltransferase PlsY